MNWFELRTMDLLIPYDYKHEYTFKDNQRLWFFQKLLNPLDLIIIPIGLFCLWFRVRKSVKETKNNDKL